MAHALPTGVPGRATAPRTVVNFPSRRPPRWRRFVPVALLVLLVVLVALYLTGELATLQRRVLGQSAAVTYQTTTVSRGTVAETVTATGPIAAAQTLPLSFKTSGKLADLKVTIGQKVKKGDVLAQLDTTDLQASLDQTKATLAQQQANFNKLKSGATPEQVQAAQVALKNAQQAANDAAATTAATQASVQRDIAASQAQVNAAQSTLQTAQSTLAAANEQLATGTTSSEQSVAQSAASLATAKAALASAQEQAQAGLLSDQTAVANAQKSLDAAKALVATSPAIQKQQLEKAKDDLWAAQINRDQACSRDQGASCKAANATVAGIETSVNNFGATAAQTQKQNDQTVQNAQNALESAKAQLQNDSAKLAASVVTAQKQVDQAQAALDTAGAQREDTLAKLRASVASAEGQVRQASAGLNTAQTGVGQAQAKAETSARSAEQTANSAQGQVKTAEASLATTSAGPTPSDLEAQAAQVANAEVAVRTAQNNLDAAKLLAPMDGTITAIGGTIGQWITGGAVTTSATSATGGIITLATLDDLQVTANVNEADVGKVKLNDPVSFTVSAFPGKTFAGQVTQIQPTGTTTSNVVNFAITSSIKSVQGTTLYPGMTAQVTVTTAERQDVILVPNSALTFARTAAQSGALAGGAGRTAGASSAGASAAGGARQGQAGAGGDAPGSAGHGSGGAGGGAPGQGGTPAGAGQGADGPGGPRAGQRAAGQAADGTGGPRAGQGGGRPGAGRPGQAADGGAPAGTPGFVMTLVDGKLSPMRVLTGMTDGTSTEIIAGLEEGQTVVTGQTGGATGGAPRTGQASNPLTGGGRPGGGPIPGFKPGG